MSKYRVIISLEGIDGAGKTTLVGLLKKEYGEEVCVYSRTKKGRLAKWLLGSFFIKNNYILQIPIYLLLSYKNYFACRYQHTASILLMDRCFLSNICYYYPSAMNNEILFKLAMLFELKLYPDEIFIIDEEPIVAQERDKMDKDLNWLTNTRINYLKAKRAKALRKFNITVIPNSLTIEEKQKLISIKMKEVGDRK